ncbi:response regulator transcription factor [bacterium]|nr:response regulator transcription factor [bacterium]
MKNSTGYLRKYEMNLSGRETQVIKLLCNGFMDKEISTKMNISKRTVQTYVERLMYKLQTRNRLALVAKYIREYERKK